MAAILSRAKWDNYDRCIGPLQGWWWTNRKFSFVTIRNVLLQELRFPKTGDSVTKHNSNECGHLNPFSVITCVSYRGCVSTVSISALFLQVNPLPPGDAIWRPIYGSTMAQITPSFTKIQSLYLKQCWLEIIGIYPCVISQKMQKISWQKELSFKFDSLNIVMHLPYWRQVNHSRPQTP